MKKNNFYLIDSKTLKTIPIANKFYIGKDKTCDLKLDGNQVSLRHTVLRIQGNDVMASDLNSFLGTFINEEKIKYAPLKHGDILRIDKKQFTFLASKKDLSIPKHLKSRNKGWQKQLDHVKNFAKAQHPVLILGESGTGKELLAQSLHNLSERKEKPLITINCGALSESLIESELFGHIEGSFTGATHSRQGAFQAAQGGTLFLDEIGELPLSLQPKLLRALENHEIKPVGSDHTIPINVRIVAATHPNLIDKVKKGKFRQDLFFRLNVIRISVPTLKERIEDFEPLLLGFCKLYKIGINYSCMQVLKKRHWTGNIRELKNFVARASSLVTDRKVAIEDLYDILDDSFWEDTSASLIPEDLDIGNNRNTETQYETNSLPSGSVLRQIEVELIKKSLKKNNGNQRQSANDLNIPKSTLHDKIKKYNIDLKWYK